MLNINNLIGFGATFVGITNAEATDTYAAQNTGSSESFAGISIGTASEDRYIIAVVGGSGDTAQNVTSISINGVAMTLYASANQTSSLNSRIGVLKVTSGTTATVAMTFGGNKDRKGFGIFALYAPNGLTVVEAKGVSSENTTINTKQGGVVCAITINNTAGTGISWTGLTEILDVNVAGFQRYGIAWNPSTTDTELTVNANGGGTACLSVISVTSP